MFRDIIEPVLDEIESKVKEYFENESRIEEYKEIQNDEDLELHERIAKLAATGAENSKIPIEMKEVKEEEGLGSLHDYGKGMFATKDLEPLEIVLVEAPILSVGSKEPEDQKMRLLYKDFTNLSKEEQRNVLNLSHDSDDHLSKRNWKELTEREKLMAIYQVNSYRHIDHFSKTAAKDHTVKIKSALPKGYVTLAPSLEALDKGGSGSKSLKKNTKVVSSSTSSTAVTESISIFPKFSRFNHTCEANCWANGRIVPGKIVVVTIKKVKKGEQLCFNYFLNSTKNGSSGTGSGSGGSMPKPAAVPSTQQFGGAVSMMQQQNAMPAPPATIEEKKKALNFTCRCKTCNNWMLLWSDIFAFSAQPGDSRNRKILSFFPCEITQQEAFESLS